MIIYNNSIIYIFIYFNFMRVFILFFLLVKFQCFRLEAQTERLKKESFSNLFYLKINNLYMQNTKATLVLFKY
jgi:hypothetical protein